MSKDVYTKSDKGALITRVKLDISLSKKNTLYSISRIQLPPKLVCAWTIHNIQGLTMPNVAVCLDLVKQMTFN